MPRTLHWTQVDVGITPWHEPRVRDVPQTRASPEGATESAHSQMYRGSYATLFFFKNARNSS